MTNSLSSTPKAALPFCGDLSQVTPDDLVARSQSGDDAALEALFHRFRPLLRARMQRLWTALREELTSLEWADVEAQVNYIFFHRAQHFEPQQGVYFAHYIERMVSLDCTAWLREQKRGGAVPFSQLGTTAGDPESWLEGESGLTHEVDSVLSLRAALDDLPKAQREAVWQVCVLGLTEEQAAERLQVSRSAVRNRLEDGLSAIRQCFDNHQTINAKTRTGRQSTKSTKSAKLALLDFWEERLFMAKDEKRPDLIGVGAGRPILLQGIFTFEPTGLYKPQLLSPKLRYVVPAGHIAGIRFVRVGIMCDQMVCLSTVVNGLTHRLVPVAANEAVHVPFAIVEPIVAGSEIEIHIASNAAGTAIIDVGCLQMPA
jgi:assimilatory nitrate reductase catalytic subunit